MQSTPLKDGIARSVLDDIDSPRQELSRVSNAMADQFIVCYLALDLVKGSLWVVLNMNKVQTRLLAACSSMCGKACRHGITTFLPQSTLCSYISKKNENEGGLLVLLAWYCQRFTNGTRQRSGTTDSTQSTYSANVLSVSFNLCTSQAIKWSTNLSYSLVSSSGE